MRAAVVERPGLLALLDIDPPRPGEYDALCRLLYGAVCSGTDLSVLDGTFPWPLEYPTVLGHESVGRVIEIGSKVRNYKVGDLVTRVGVPAAKDGRLHSNWGGFAEFGIARDHWAMQQDGVPRATWETDRVNQVVPPDIAPAEATMFVTWRETLSSAGRVGVTRGKSILVIGSGGVGLSFAAHARNRGATPVVMIGDRRRESAGASVGVTDFYRYDEPDVIPSIAGRYPDGFEIVIDAFGSENSADQALSLLADNAVLNVYGLHDYWRQKLTLSRARGSFSVFRGGYDEAEAHGEVIDMVRAGRLDASRWLDLSHPFPLPEIGAALRATREEKVIKALISLAE